MKKIYDALSVAIDNIDRKYYEDAAEFLPIDSNVFSRHYSINEEDLIEMKHEEKKISYIVKMIAIAAAFIVTFVAVAFALSAKNTPDVSAGNSTSEIDKVYKEKIKVSELSAAIEEALRVKTDNLILPDKILVDDNIVLKDYRKVPVKYDLQADFQNILEDYFGKDSVSEKYFSQTNPQYLDYINTENNNRAAVSESGGYLVLTKHGGLGLKMSNDEHPIEAVYHIDRNDYTDTEYKLSGENYSVDEAASFAENWARDFWSEYHPEYEYSAKTVVVRPAPKEIDESGNSFTYEIIIELKLGGVPIDELGQLITNDDGTTFFNEYIKIKMVKPEDVFYFHGESWSFSASLSDDGRGEEKVIDEIISPSHAVTLVSEYMAGYNKLKVNSFSLKYAVASDRLVPVWAFEMDVNKKTPARTSIYVNAVTGEVYTEMEYTIIS